MVESIQPFIEQLQMARTLKGLSQRALASKVGITQSHLSKIEQGKVDVQLSTLLNLARVLDCDVVIVPRHMVAVIQALDSSRHSKDPRPKFALDNGAE